MYGVIRLYWGHILDQIEIQITRQDGLCTCTGSFDLSQMRGLHIYISSLWRKANHFSLSIYFQYIISWAMGKATHKWYSHLHIHNSVI